MINYLLSNAFRTVTLSQTSVKIYESCSSLVLFCDSLHDKNISAFLSNEAEGLSTRFERLSFPDLVWSTISLNNHSLHTYPLGDIIERSVKQTVGSLFLNSPSISSTNIENRSDSDQFIREVYRVSDSVDTPSLLKEFLSNIFFNQCIVVLRSKSGRNTDFGYSYQYKNGNLVSLEEQLALRQGLLGKCKEMATALVPHIVRSFRKRVYTSKTRTVSEGLTSVLPFIQWNPTMNSSPGSKPHINILVGTKSRAILSLNYELDSAVQRIILDGIHKNVSFNLSDIESFVGHPLHSLTKDFLEIAFVVYISDLYVSRKSDYSRNLDILIPVRHPDIWERSGSKLENAISFLARDSVSLRFTAKNERRDDITSFNTSEESKCCCLFSGGVDSAAGVLWAINHGLSPTLISYASGNLSGIQSTLANQIERKTSYHPPHLKVSWQAARRRSGSYRLGERPNSMLYQHLRSFFYLAIAYAVALESSISSVYIFENGPIALNPLLSESHINTRTVHPRFLEYFQSAMQAVFETNISIENPFIYRTKSQLTSYIKNKRLANDIIPYTSSCFAYARVKTLAQKLDDYDYQGTHDGDCLPCIIRRISLIAGHIPAQCDEHLIDIFDIFESPSFLRLPNRSLDSLVTIADLLRFSECLLRMSVNEIQYNFPDLYVYSRNLDCARISNTYQRYAMETINSFRQQSSTRLSGILEPILSHEVNL